MPCKKTIREGWPNSWSSETKYMKQSGYFFCRNRIISLQQLHNNMLKLVQESHLGWTSVIQVFVLLSTGLGLQRKSKLSSVPVRHIITVKNRWSMPHDIPEQPWKKFAMDIMTFKGNDYIVAVNHSKFLEKVELNVCLCISNWYLSDTASVK